MWILVYFLYVHAALVGVPFSLYIHSVEVGETPIKAAHRWTEYAERKTYTMRQDAAI